MCVSIRHKVRESGLGSVYYKHYKRNSVDVLHDIISICSYY